MVRVVVTDVVGLGPRVWQAGTSYSGTIHAWPTPRVHTVKTMYTRRAVDWGYAQQEVYALEGYAVWQRPYLGIHDTDPNRNNHSNLRATLINYSPLNPAIRFLYPWYWPYPASSPYAVHTSTELYGSYRMG